MVKLQVWVSYGKALMFIGHPIFVIRGVDLLGRETARSEWASHPVGERGNEVWR